MNRFKFAMAAVVGALMASTSAAAGTLVVSGDSTIGPRFKSAVDTGAANLQGNTAFQTNLLGGGSNVAVYRFSAINSFPNPPIGEQVADTYNSLGYNASVFTSAIDTNLLAGNDLLVLFGSSKAFSTDETTAIKNFLFDGGNVLLAGESSNIGSTANARLNELLIGLGSSMRIVNGREDAGDRFAIGDEILADPLTAGVESFGYGFTSTVTGGRGLFLTDNDNVFVAAEDIAAPVPEPTTWAMLIVGFGAVGGALRGQRRTRTRFAF